MRKWHRWLSVIFAAFLLWISVTGILSQIVPWFDHGSGPHAAAAFVFPAYYTCRPKPIPGSVRTWVSFLHDLHSGAKFGPLGIWISILSGFALLFFAFSGLWMYIQMWRARHARSLKPGWFWK